jgi:mannose-6-phosphate isomerase-like protein (cupin superfamily)
MKTLNPFEKPAQVSTRWDPHIIAKYNDNGAIVVKFTGEFPIHLQNDTDDFSLVLQGGMTMDIEETSHRAAGEMFIVPHRPCAATECHVVLIAPKGTPNTGHAATVSSKPRI